jgi:hypothetical protein
VLLFAPTSWIVDQGVLAPEIGENRAIRENRGL